ncbi:MAG: DUF624 domain-containing protein [Eubacteriales bacterium]|nr:DUF624 domain-containing protein [Eubacteriales bacterium]
MNNKLWRGMERISDLLILNLLVIVFSVPLITAGAAMTALHGVCLQMVKNEEGPIIRCFIKVFRRNLRQSIPITVILLGGWIFLLLQLILLWQVNSLICGILIMGMTVLLAETIFVFPLLAFFENKSLAMMTNAILILIKYPSKTLLILTTTIFCILITLATQKTIIIGAVMWSLFGVSTLIYLHSFVMRTILDDLSI